MPEAAPVTSAVLPLKSNIDNLLFLYSAQQVFFPFSRSEEVF
jgi:hypothetical protein